MSIKHHTQPHLLERYSFLWSEARLVIAAISLFLGGTPLLAFIIPGLYGMVGTLLMLAWIISGLASAYLLYRWFTGAKKLFGGNDRWDTVAFFVSVISGLNLGITGLTRNNPGMSFISGWDLSGLLMLIIVGIAYLVSAWHLWRRWKQSEEKIIS